jgi:hypothetical protein
MLSEVIMESQEHPLASLFKQLGLDNTEQSIQRFIDQNAPLLSNIELHEAAFWNSSQASFLQQSKADDADWAEIVDTLDAMLRKPSA